MLLSRAVSAVQRRAADTDRPRGLEPICVATAQGLEPRLSQDCKSVRSYASDQCPRQDSNLRSRLRRGLLYRALTRGNESPHTMIGGVSGATAWPRLPGRNGRSSNRMRRLHNKTHPLIAAMRHVGTPSAGHWRLGHQERVQCPAQKLITQRGQPEGCSSACNRRQVWPQNRLQVDRRPYRSGRFAYGPVAPESARPWLPNRRDVFAWGWKDRPPWVCG